MNNALQIVDALVKPRRFAGRYLLQLVIALLMFVTQITPQTAELVVQTGHSAGVNYVLFSPAGRPLAGPSPGARAAGSGVGRSGRGW